MTERDFMVKRTTARKKSQQKYNQTEKGKKAKKKANRKQYLKNRKMFIPRQYKGETTISYFDFYNICRDYNFDETKYEIYLTEKNVKLTQF